MASFGEELKRERELRSIGLREVAEATKVNIRYLEAIERNEFEHLPGGVFNRGFVRAYAQYIGVDPETMVNAYLLEAQGQGGRARGTDANLLRGRRSSVAETQVEQRRSAGRRGGRPLLRWGLLGLLIVALVIAAAVVWVIVSDAKAAPPRVGRTAAAGEGL